MPHMHLALDVHLTMQLQDKALQNFFRRGLSCGALCIEEVHKLGLQIEEIQQKFS